MYVCKNMNVAILATLRSVNWNCNKDNKVIGAIDYANYDEEVFVLKSRMDYLTIS